MVKRATNRGRWNCVSARVAFIWALVCLFAAPGAAPQAQKQDLTISAAVSLKDALEEIQKLFRTEHPETTVHFNLGASGTLQRQVEQGAPIDVFISASSSQMDSLEADGLLVPGTRKDLLRNEVVLIAPKGKTQIARFEDLTRPDVKRIAVGEPQTVPAGKYAQEVLTHFGIYEHLKPKFVRGKDVRQVLTYVATGNVDAGIVYATDAYSSPEVAIVATAPADSHSPVIYPVAVMKDSKNKDGAEEFVEFLLGSKAQSVFRKYGFLAPR